MTTQLTVPEPSFLGPEVVERLVLGAPLGAGASAEVHVAHGVPGAAPDAVVVKIARPGMDEVLLREAIALTLARGPGVTKLLGLGRSDGRVTLLFTREKGVTLDRALVRADLSAAERLDLALEVLRSLAPALARLHALGWAHRDVKPENILVDVDGDRSVTLIDFGLASDEVDVHSGTPLYLPARALAGQPVAAIQADTYALCRTVAGILDSRWHAELGFVDEFALIPEPLRRLLVPVLRQDTVVFPDCQWLLSTASELGLFSVQRELNLEQQYIATRFAELMSVSGACELRVDGLPAKWCTEVLRVLPLVSALRRGARGAPTAELRVLDELSSADRRRFLGRVLGPVASGWDVSIQSDGALIDALVRLERHGSLRGITQRQLAEALQGSPQTYQTTPRPSRDACSLAFALSERPPSTASLLEVRHLENAPEPLLVRAARVARLTGELALCQHFVEQATSPGGRLEMALLLTRQGQRPQAEAVLAELSLGDVPPGVQSHALSMQARFALDRGDLQGASSFIARAGHAAARFEVEALIQLASGNVMECVRAIDEGLTFAETEESRARLLGVRGMLEHSRGESAAALRTFAQAVEFARAVGAALEEATYLTGLAACASDSGDVAQALDASERAEQLFEALGKPDQAARALLARAAALAAVGARAEVETVVARGLMLAQKTRDARCEAYLLLCQWDNLNDSSLRGNAVGSSGTTGARAKLDQLARTAEGLLGEQASDADRLSVASRWVLTDASWIERGDAWAARTERVDVCLDWWAARSELLLRTAVPDAAQATFVLGKLEPIAQSGALPLGVGPALVLGAQLALRVGRSELARLFLERAASAATHLLEHVRPMHRAAVLQLSWIEQAQGSRTSTSDRADQLSDVEGLLKALGRRQGFRALLDQVLDMLLLWTGVERGLLLLRAPEGKLVVRAARNLDRTDLSVEQRALSLSVARRAMDEGRPVLLVDAGGDESSLYRSVVSLHLRSVLAVPLAARGEILGVAYLDDRAKRAAFGQKELSWANLIATVAALAIWDERDRLTLRRALRRAKRAEAKLAQRLTENELELELAQRELNRFRESRKVRGHDNIIGKSRSMRELLSLVDRVADSDVPALIEGESGTGKELIARAIAGAGARRGKAFVAENCGAVPETLLESALFGHKKGAFTGASRNQPGLFALAHGGTLFLDEIGEMPLSMQTKLLRVIQEREVRPLGAERPERVDVRLLVATHRDLDAMVAEGKFRQDLYFRLNVIKLRVPPLRERPEDIPLLVAHFLAQHATRARTLSNAALSRLCSYSWPGNVRQLENEVRRMIVLGGDHLTAADLSPELLAASTESAPVANTLREKLDALERQLVMEALEQAGGNRTRAADALGVSRFGLQKMTQRLKIDVDASLSGRIRARGLDERR